MTTTWENELKHPIDYLLLEEGGYLLLEEGGQVILEETGRGSTTWTNETKN